jgi:hypothetical protein
MSAKTLIEEDLCPAWVLPSMPVLGRCLPVGVTAGSNATVIDTDKTPDSQAVSSATLANAIYQLVTH